MKIEHREPANADRSEVPLGGVITNVGTGPKYQTGSWRTQRPIFNADRLHQLPALLDQLPGRLHRARKRAR